MVEAIASEASSDPAAKHGAHASYAGSRSRRPSRGIVPPGTVLADSFYGNDFFFRAALRGQRLDYAVAVEAKVVVRTEDPTKVPVRATAKTGRPRVHRRLADLPEAISLEALARQLPKKAWRTVTWRAGIKGPQRSRFTRVGIWAAHGRKAQGHPLRGREWLLVEWPEEAPAPSDYWMLWRGVARDEAPALLQAVPPAPGSGRVREGSPIFSRISFIHVCPQS